MKGLAEQDSNNLFNICFLNYPFSGLLTELIAHTLIANQFRTTNNQQPTTNNQLKNKY